MATKATFTIAQVERPLAIGIAQQGLLPRGCGQAAGRRPCVRYLPPLRSSMISLMTSEAILRASFTPASTSRQVGPRWRFRVMPEPSTCSPGPHSAGLVPVRQSGTCKDRGAPGQVAGLR